MAERGIGAVGAVQPREWLWQLYVSSRQVYLLSSTEESRKVRGATTDMLGANARTGALRQLSRGEADALGIPWSPTAAAFTHGKGVVFLWATGWTSKVGDVNVTPPALQSLPEALRKQLNLRQANLLHVVCTLPLPHVGSHLVQDEPRFCLGLGDGGRGRMHVGV